MLKNNRHLFACCAVCGAVVAYLVSIYVFVIVVVACVFLLVIDFKLLEQVATATRAFSFPVPSWVKTIITALMNSYHLSKPLEPEPNSRRGSSYSPNVLISRKPNCRSSRYTCLDENTDYVNRRNGIGLCNPSSPFNTSYSNNLQTFKRHNNFSDPDNSSKTEDFTSSHTSPWTRRQNYSGNDFNNVRRVQTIAGPLLASSGVTKRKSNDFGLLVDANSPGLASRIVQYREDGTSSPGSTVWTHQPQYSSPGQFPMVHLTHSPSSLPVLSPMSSQKASRRSVRVKIAPPDPLGSRLYPLSTKANNTYTTTVQTDHSTKSVLETLKEISRKRIHSQLEDNDNDIAKRQKRSDMSNKLPSGDPTEGENMSKRLREESPRQQETSPPVRPTKRIRNNEILSSLSSSRKLLQSGGVKRKTQNLDWSRCSTPVLGKQQKTVGEDSDVLPPLLSNVTGANISPGANNSSTRRASDEVLVESGQKSTKTPEIGKRKTNGLSWTKSPLSEKGISKTTLKENSTTVKKGPTSFVDNSPWQKDSPFVIAASADDVIDDVSALEEKREEDRRSRLVSMMTVISGGEPPVKIPETVVSQSATVNSVASADNTQKPAFSLGNSSLLSSSAAFSSITSGTAPGNNLVAASTIPNSWGSNAASPEESPTVPSPSESTQISDPVASVGPLVSSPASGTIVSNSMPTTPIFGLGNTTASSVVQKSQDKTDAPDAFTTLSAVSSTRPSVSSVFGSPPTTSLTSHITSVSSSPVFGSVAGLFGSKPATSTGIPIPSFSNQNQQLADSVAATTSSSSNFSFGFTSAPNTQVPLPTPSTQPSSTAALPVTSVSVTSVPTSPVFQLRPAVSGLGQDNTVSSSSGCFSASGTISASQGHSFTKAIAFGAPEKITDNSQFSNSVPAVSATVPFGSSVSTSVSESALSPAVPSFGFGTSVSNTTPTSGLQMKSGIFSFGSSSPSLNSLATSGSGANKPIFGSPTSGFGPTIETPVTSSLASNQLVNTQPVTAKVGGFNFPLPIGSPTNMLGNSASEAGNKGQKPFTFGSAKPVDNPFALNALKNNNSSVTVSQAQIPANPFGLSTMQQKATVGGPPKESLFSFGGNTGTHQPGALPLQPATVSASGGFSFSPAPAGAFNQPGTGASGFSLQPTVISTANFSTPTASITTPTTHAGSAFGFGNTVPNQTPQSSNPFAFGDNKNSTETQPGNLFAFGSNTAPVRPGSLFGASATPAGQTQPSGQPVAAGPSPAQPFQFGSSAGTAQLSGTFSFGASPNTSNPASAFPSGGSFQINNTSGFGSGPAMFSIGSGSTAPRVRNSRSRRTK